MVKVGQIIQALPSLTQNELRAISVAVASLVKQDSNSADEELFHATLDVLGVKSIGWLQFKRTKAFSTWVKNQPVIDSLIDKIIGDFPKNKVKTIHLKRFLISLLVADLKAKRIDISMPNIATHLSVIDCVFDDCFPNYIKCGLTSLILKGLAAEK